jgi:hypothetical protein
LSIPALGAGVREFERLDHAWSKDDDVRVRMQLAKLVDEGGLFVCGKGMPHDYQIGPPETCHRQCTL